MSAFYLPDENGKQRMCYLIAFLDDHSRRILHAQFYFDASLSRLEDCLKKAVIKFAAPDSLSDDTKHIVPDEKIQALKRQEFVEIISTALGMKTLSYAEKGKLYELWQTFKEFNKDLLIAIVDDIER